MDGGTNRDQPLGTDAPFKWATQWTEQQVRSNYVGIEFGKELDQRDDPPTYQDFENRVQELIDTGGLDLMGGFA